MNATLHVTLGHNASAALAIDGKVIRAYEQERIDRKKNSSAYPREAIEMAIGDLKIRPHAYVGHWFDDMQLKTNKYIDLDHLQSVSDGIMSISPHFTHHDLHAASAMSFYGEHIDVSRKVYTIVLDGFGTNQECFSVYYGGQLMHRTYGYDMSLGLMYQYATEYLKLKPLQDEYKLLGYESHVTEYMSETTATMIRGRMRDIADLHTRAMLMSTARPKTGDTLIDFAALLKARNRWMRHFDLWRDFYEVDSMNGFRAMIAFCAQAFLEQCVLRLIDQHIPYRENPDAIIALCGGCHLNVKLNRAIQVHTGLSVLSHPLAGDQGTALGFIPVTYPDGLALGERSLGSRTTLPVGVQVVDKGQWVERALTLLHDDRIVNVVRGAMEFGPRALCNTTTFARPTKKNVTAINALNERDEAMPMAPAMLYRDAYRFLNNEEIDAIGPSAEYMITTCAFVGEPPEGLSGVAHKDPLRNLWTARPQLVPYEQQELYHLLLDVPYGTLINTSFNYHGEPIVFTEDDACKTHSMQTFRAGMIGIEPPVTLIVRS